MTALCPAVAVATGAATLVRLSQTRSVILLRRSDGAIAAWRNACPHMGIELDWEATRLLSRDGRYLRCTGHGALFRHDSGLCVRGPCVGEALQSLPIRLEDGMIMLDAEMAND